MVVSIKFESNQDYQTDAINAVTGLFKGVGRGGLGSLMFTGQQIDGSEKELFQDVVYGNRLPDSDGFAELVKSNIRLIQSRTRKDRDEKLQPIVPETMRQSFTKEELPIDYSIEMPSSDNYCVE